MTISEEIKPAFIIAGRFEVDPDDHDLVAGAMATMQEATWTEEGCIGYTFSADLSERGVFHLFEQWKSMDALEAHFVAPHMKAFQEALGNARFRGRATAKYDVSAVGPVR